MKNELKLENIKWFPNKTVWQMNLSSTEIKKTYYIKPFLK